MNNPSVSEYKIKDHPFGKKDEFSVPKDRRKSNDLPVKENSVSPQTYDCLTGHGYVDVKNLKVIEKLSQTKMNS